MLVSAWLPYPRESHPIVRSATTGTSDSMTVENAVYAGVPITAMSFTRTVRRPRAGTTTPCPTSVAPSRKNRSHTCASIAGLGFISAMLTSKKPGMIAPSAKYRRFTPPR